MVKECSNGYVSTYAEFKDGGQDGVRAYYDQVFLYRGEPSSPGYLSDIGKYKKREQVEAMGFFDFEDPLSDSQVWHFNYSRNFDIDSLSVQVYYHLEHPNNLDSFTSFYNGNYHGFRKEFDKTGAVKLIAIYYLGQLLDCKGQCDE